MFGDDSDSDGSSESEEEQRQELKGRAKWLKKVVTEDGKKEADMKQRKAKAASAAAAKVQGKSKLYEPVKRPVAVLEEELMTEEALDKKVKKDLFCYPGVSSEDSSN